MKIKLCNVCQGRFTDSSLGAWNFCLPCQQQVNQSIKESQDGLETMPERLVRLTIFADEESAKEYITNQINPIIPKQPTMGDSIQVANTADEIKKALDSQFKTDSTYHLELHSLHAHMVVHHGLALELDQLQAIAKEAKKG